MEQAQFGVQMSRQFNIVAFANGLDRYHQWVGGLIIFRDLQRFWLVIAADQQFLAGAMGRRGCSANATLPWSCGNHRFLFHGSRSRLVSRWIHPIILCDDGAEFSGDVDVREELRHIA